MASNLSDQVNPVMTPRDKMTRISSTPPPLCRVKDEFSSKSLEHVMVTPRDKMIRISSTPPPLCRVKNGFSRRPSEHHETLEPRVLETAFDADFNWDDVVERIRQLGPPPPLII